MINVNELSYEVGNKIVIDNFSYKFEKSKIYCIFGKSGTGKTTLLYLIGMLLKPSKGDITIEGKLNPKINNKDGKELLKNNIGYIFQDFMLIEDKDVSYNLKLAAKFSKFKDFSDILKKVGLENYENRKVSTLSGGEKQRIAIARLLVKDVNIIFADEPTGSLDEENRDEIIKLFKELSKDRIVIIVTHDFEFKKIADEEIYL